MRQQISQQLPFTISAELVPLTTKYGAIELKPQINHFLFTISEALTLVDGEVAYSVQWRLRHDSLAIRALVRITRGPGFNPQLHCLNFSLPPSRCQCFLSFDWFC